jgi:long-chain acyl-CoA synthetase
MAYDSIPSRFLAQGAQRPEAPAYFVKVDGAWRATRWRDYVGETRMVARALIAEGVGPGKTVGILGFNRPEWVSMAIATMLTGGAPAGIYTTCSAEEVQYILAHSEALVVLLEDEAQWAKVRSVRDRLPALKRVVLMKGAPAVDDPMVMTWEAFVASGEATEDAEVDRRVEAIEPSGLSTLIYTSGTTGPPKGVMLSHENIAWTASAAATLVKAQAGQVMLSYLPLSHIAEQMFSIHGAATIGLTIYFAESIERVPDNLREAQPEVFFGVPRIWEKFFAVAGSKLKDATGAKAVIVKWARGVALDVHGRLDRGESVPMWLDAQHRLADRLFYSKFKGAVGLGRAKMCVSGAAPVGREVLEFFTSLDLPVREVYGQSEDTGPTSFNLPGDTRLGTVGKPIAGVTVKIAEDGEILVKGPNVFLGYFKDPEATAATLQEGWLCSGDLGRLDPDGFLVITGRKKEILITSGGKNITPKNIEEDLKRHDLIGEVVVIGDRRPYLTALMVLRAEGLARWAKEHGRDPAEAAKTAHDDPDVRAELQRAVDDVNSRLARVETIKRFTILPRPLDIEHGELTPTLKIKRAIVYKVWSEAIEAMYAERA